MFKIGNSKLGPLVHTWSLPVVNTCPGASKACLAACYAKTYRLALPSHKKLHRNNLRISRRDNFVDRAVRNLREQLVARLRLHVAGDFYSAAYVDKWRAIARRCRRVQFLAYTRSWMDPDILPSLLKFSELSNVSLWFSFDHSMPVPPSGIPKCYLSMTDLDMPKVPVDLMFRRRRKTVMKRADNGSIICPHENGITVTNCSSCKICWQGGAVSPLVQLSLSC